MEAENALVMMHMMEWWSRRAEYKMLKVLIVSNIDTPGLDMTSTNLGYCTVSENTTSSGLV